MSTLLMDLVRQLQLGQLTKAVLFMMAFHVDDRHHKGQRRLLPRMPVAVNYEMLANDLGAGERSVRRALDELVRLGLVSYGRRATDRRHKDYLIEVDAILALVERPSQGALTARLAASDDDESSGQSGHQLAARVATISRRNGGQGGRQLVAKYAELQAAPATIEGSHLDLDLSGTPEDLPGERRPLTLKAHKHCDSVTRRACDAGVCVPRLLASEWLGQCLALGASDDVAAEVIDRAIEYALGVEDPAARVRLVEAYGHASTIGDKFRLWNAAWAAWARRVGGLKVSLELVTEARKAAAS